MLFGLGGSPGAAKSESESLQNRIRIFTDFRIQKGTEMEPKEHPFGAKIASTN